MNEVEAVELQRFVACRTSSITNMRLPQSLSVGYREMSHPALCVVTLGVGSPRREKWQGWQPCGDGWILASGILILMRLESLIIRAHFMRDYTPEKPVDTRRAFIRAQSTSINICVLEPAHRATPNR